MILAFTFQNLLPATDRLAEMAWRIGLTLLFAFLVQRVLFLLWGRLAALVGRAAHGDPAAVQRVRTIKLLLRHLTTLGVTLFAVLHSLAVLGWDVRPLLAGAGLVGVAVGFGAQTLVRDWIAGFFFLIENQFGVGDLIEINGRTATVEALNIRSTQLRDFNGTVWFVPNGELKMVANHSRDWNRVAVDVPLRAGQDLEAALEVSRDTAREMNEDPQWTPRLLEPIRVWGIDQVGADAVLRLVLRSRPGAETAEAARELRLRLHQALKRAGFQYPLAPAAPPAAAERNR